MTMNKSILLATLVLLPFAACAQQSGTAQQTALPTVSISANGVDVKSILHDLFTQAKKSYVIQPNTYYNLNLALDNVDFDEALAIICRTANLKTELQNGIYFVSKCPTKATIPQKIAAVPAAPPKAVRLPESVFAKKLTTRMNRAELAEVFESFAKQAGVKIEIDKSVPAYKLDAFLINTSLRYALERVTKAVGVDFELTDHASIRIFKPTPVDPNHVALSAP